MACCFFLCLSKSYLRRNVIPLLELNYVEPIDRCDQENSPVRLIAFEELQLDVLAEEMVHALLQSAFILACGPLTFEVLHAAL
jgi:hypothetical protein